MDIFLRGVIGASILILAASAFLAACSTPPPASPPVTTGALWFPLGAECVFGGEQKAFGSVC